MIGDAGYDTTKITQYNTSFGKCSHKKPKLVGGVPGFTLWAGSGRENCVPPTQTVVVDLADMYGVPIRAEGAITVPKELQESRIIIEWPDMQAPSILKAEWPHIVAWLKKLQRKRAFSEGVYLACSAGHGRTGTALAILGYLTGIIPKADDPIVWVRKAYCREAIETGSQISYIEDILGIKTEEKGSNFGVAVSNYNTGPKCRFTAQGNTNPQHTHTCSQSDKTPHLVHWCPSAAANGGCGKDWVKLIDGVWEGGIGAWEHYHKTTEGKETAKRLAPLTQPPLTVEPPKPVTTYDIEWEYDPTKPFGVGDDDEDDKCSAGKFDDAECNASAPEHLNTDTCIHMCSRAWNHRGKHRCLWCKARWQNKQADYKDVGAT